MNFRIIGVLGLLFFLLSGCSDEVFQEAKVDSSHEKQEKIVFHDPSFEKEIRSLLGEKEGDLSETDLQTIEEFEGNAKIKSYKDLKYLKNLNKLVLPPGSKDIEAIERLNHLEELHMSPNKENLKILTSSLTELKNLHNLWLNNSNLGSYDFLNQPSDLEEIHISGDSLTELPAWPKMKNLKKLFMDSNKINNIQNLKLYPQLSNLSLEFNQIKDISPIAELHNLEYIDFANNNIGDISSIEQLGKLKGAYLQNNKNKDLSPLKNKAHLTDLQLVSNQISDIAPISTLPVIQRLYIFNNPLSDLSLKLLKKWKEGNKEIFYENEHA
ncbi:leucine-rich repeat domain-containing protein [Falsibacillus pallidus]|uniref:leucine-rich repeat domain-containing protein n=1 Tax=Falsibacillus pallidus TaxID=493781 RepID=UPI003D96D430